MQFQLPYPRLTCRTRNAAYVDAQPGRDPDRNHRIVKRLLR